MLNKIWRKWLANAPRQRNAEVRLGVETLERRSLLAGIPVLLMFDASFAPSRLEAIEFAARGESSSSSSNLFVGVRGWTAQESVPRTPTIVVIVNDPPPRGTPVNGSPANGSPGNGRIEPGLNLGRPAGQPFVHPGFGGQGSLGGRPGANDAEGEPPDDPPVSRPDSVPPTLPSRPPVSSPGTGLESPANPLGGASKSSSNSALNLPGSGSNGRDLPPSGSERSNSSTTGILSTSPNSADAFLASSNRALATFGATGSLWSNSAAQVSNLSSTDVDRWWGSWSTSRPDSLGYGSSVVGANSRFTTIASLWKSSSATGQDSKDESLDSNADDELGFEDNSSGVPSRQSDRREPRSNRLVRGLRLKQVGDRDWTASARPSDDAVDAILAELHRVPVDAGEAPDDADEGGLIEVIIAAAADTLDTE